MEAIFSLFSQYQILKLTSRHLSTLDLLYLALTCSELNTIIRKSEHVWNRLKREAVCDGRGLKTRQEFQRLYALTDKDCRWGTRRRARYDEEIEVRVWNLKCDAGNALPCHKCGINVCEECRYVPRVRDLPGWKACRRPHFDPAWESHTVICYCTECDRNVDRELPLFLNEYCDCDQYTRWICLPCKEKEDKADVDYYSTRTKGQLEFEGDLEEGMWLHDHQQLRAFWCPCGVRAPKDTNVRCAWCKRKHNLDTWKDEDPSDIPFFDDVSRPNTSPSYLTLYLGS
ncbi:hypothetical protein B0O99DRAFT_529451 [Bisporella sp. PMI_857]|nr:hypothetical protein B0O99DRAFT_529451 [Bisporella sp. PMI_857]